MTNELKSIQKEFKARMEQLEHARVQLKKEFIGIEQPIDQIIDNVRSWYTMPALQDRPSVVNLWGLTGVGKTSVLFRLMELLQTKDYCYHFDMGEKSGSYSFREKFSELCENDANEPIAIILDEFQLARTIKQGIGREEIEDDKSRIVWELIDSGKISDIKWRRGMFQLSEYIKKLEHLIQTGLTAKNGKVTSQHVLYAREILNYSDHDLNNVNESSELSILPDFIQSLLFNGVASDFGWVLETELEEQVAKMTAADALETALKGFTYMKRPQVKHFTQAIIFIVGNIDEAYHMNKNYSADIDADEFHELSLNVKLPNIKYALRNRFRDEQIARLGNTHIIYPALKRKNYEAIIQQEFQKIHTAIRSKYGIHLNFDNSVMQKVYREGVFPTQGVRPVHTTIQQLVKSHLSSFIEQIIVHNLTIDTLQLSVNNISLCADYLQENTAQFSFAVPLLSTLDELRKTKRDDQQAITAVHEAGHGVLTAALFNTYPEYLLSVTSDANNAGFVYTKFDRKFLTRKDVIRRAAVLLGGIVAEELIFGSDYVTDGNSSDIIHAYQLVSHLLKEEGFSDEPLLYSHSAHNSVHAYHQHESIEDQIRQLIIDAKALATETLQREKKLLLLTAGYLSENSKMDQQQFKTFVAQYASQQFVAPIPENYFRQKLTQEIETLGVLENTLQKNPVVMNKE